MNPPLRHGGRPPRARRGPPRRHDRLHRHRPRTARATREGRAVRAGAVRRDRARDGVRRAQHVPRPRGRGSAATLLERLSAGPARRSGSRCRGSRSASPRTSSCSTSRRSGRCGRTRSARARRTRGSSGRRSSARSSRPSPPAGWCSRHEGRGQGYLLLEDGTVFRGRSVAPRAPRSARPCSRPG